MYANIEGVGIELIECTESEFKEEVQNGAHIDYERDTLFGSGIKQVCLTAVNY